MNNTHQPHRQYIRRLVVCGLTCLSGMGLHAQNLIEYFWNTDPGVGHATMVRGQGERFTLTADHLTEGANLLGIRALNGKYASPTMLSIVCKSTSLSECGRIEYFWDNDPGVGMATAIPLNMAADGTTSALSLPTDGLSDGIHLLGLRVGGSVGWSATYSYMMAVAPHGGRIDCVEYFWDDDPGLGLATRYAVPDGSGSDVVVSMDVLCEGLSRGIHMLGIRSRCGTWSQTLRRAVVVGADNNPVEAVEYFWDDDPGMGLATPLSFTGTDMALVNENIDTPADYGKHVLVIRAMAGGVWGTPLVQTFCINAIPDFSLPADTVCRGEKFIVSNMTQGATAETTYSWDMDGDGKPDATSGDDFVYSYAKAGEYMVSLSVRTVGDCESTCIRPIVVLDTTSPQVSISASTKTSCAGDTVCFVAKATNAGTRPEYEWTVNGETVNDVSGDTLLVSTLANRDQVRVTVISSNPCSQVDAATSSAITMTVRELPDVSLAPMFPVYTNEGRFILSGGQPDGGTYYINGHEAALFNPQSNEPGLYTIAYRYADSRGCVSEAVQTFELRTPGAGSLLLGDVNKDERVDVMDVMCTVDYIFGQVFPTWNKQTADINKDGRIDVTDVVGIASIIIGGNEVAAMAKVPGQAGIAYGDMTLAATDAYADRTAEVLLDFKLSGTDRPSGVQFDITLPDGVELASVTDGLVVGRKLGSTDNTYTLLAYSADLSPVSETLSVRATLPVNMEAGTYPIIPENVVMAAADMRNIANTIVAGKLFVGTTTGMTGIENGRMGMLVESAGLRVFNAAGGSLSVYDISGRFVVAFGINADNEFMPLPALAPGTYVGEINRNGQTVRTKFICKN